VFAVHLLVARQDSVFSSQTEAMKMTRKNHTKYLITTFHSKFVCIYSVQIINFRVALINNSPKTVCSDTFNLVHQAFHVQYPCLWSCSLVTSSSKLCYMLPKFLFLMLKIATILCVNFNIFLGGPIPSFGAAACPKFCTRPVPTRQKGYFYYLTVTLSKNLSTFVLHVRCFTVLRCD